ncbi:MAG TPA: hypothetical protein DIV38_04985 [Clostridiales bacterium]|nr:hypothetical protein [Clostridiales bacterium]
MGIIDILLTGVGLSMDAAAVSMTNGMNEPKMKLPKILLIALFYGVAQGVMPLIGYYAGSLFATAVAKIAPWLALVLLGFIGGKMIFEAICELKKNGEQPKEAKPLSLGSLAVQALATSIDALAVGISLVALDKSGALAVNIFVAVSMIAASTFIISLVSVFVGKKFGELLSDKAELVGGLILVAIGLKIFIEGIFF